jgi:cytochrome bd-type quinol oxidase subunit 1
MLDTIKGALSSKTVWGGIVTVASVIAGIFGYTVAEGDTAALVEAISQLGAVVGGIIAIVGRIYATKKIG